MEVLTCRVRIKIPTIAETDKDFGDAHKFDLVALKDCPETPPKELTLKWAEGLLEILHEITAQQDAADFLRPFDLVLDQNGSVESIAAETPPPGDPEGFTYPAPFRIPLDTLVGLGQEEIRKRSELFALGGLLYETVSIERPFSDLEDDEEIQNRYKRGKYPDDAFDLPFAPASLSCWSKEFKDKLEAEIAARSSQDIPARIRNYIQRNPVQFGLQVAGGVVAMASLVAVPILGAIGFSAVGPVAGSVAAGWQSSIGIVQAGSIFAWCQSAAMGGAAVGGLVAGGAAGAGVVAAASLPMMLPGGLKERFERVVRKVDLESKL